MKIVIPMAGYGTRLRPHTWSKPKPLVTVAGKPVLGHVLDMFQVLKAIDEVIFIVGYLGEQVETYVSQTYPHLNARYVVQEEMLGQSHAIWLAREGLEGPMLMVFADTIIETDLARALSEEIDGIAWVKEVPDPRRFGVAKIDSDGNVTQMIEKPDDISINLALAGFYYFKEAERLIGAIEQQLAEGEKLKGEYFLVDAINILLEQGLAMRVETVDVWQDCGKPETLLETNRYLLEHGRDNSSKAAKRDGVLVLPPVFIDPSADIRHSIIGPNVTIGADCVIQRSVLRDSIVDVGSLIVDSMLSESVIGREAKVSGRDRSLNVGDSSEVGFA
ncbi:MAG: NTP transferase domain-containing protein [Anaerolineales bacterium]|nr:NTP transferase domain-containing protein [Anaerolineales bacterium]